MQRIRRQRGAHDTPTRYSYFVVPFIIRILPPTTAALADERGGGVSIGYRFLLKYQDLTRGISEIFNYGIFK